MLLLGCWLRRTEIREALAVHDLGLKIFCTGGAGGLRARPSYLGSGEIQLATHAPHSPAGAGVTPAQNGGGSFTAGRRQGSTGRGDSPTRSGGAIPQPQSAFYHQAQELRKDSSPVRPPLQQLLQRKSLTCASPVHWAANMQMHATPRGQPGRRALHPTDLLFSRLTDGRHAMCCLRSHLFCKLPGFLLKRVWSYATLATLNNNTLSVMQPPHSKPICHPCRPSPCRPSPIPLRVRALQLVLLAGMHAPAGASSLF